MSLFVTRKNAVKLKKDEYFIADLIGLNVEEEDGRILGTVKDVLLTGANDVYIVEREDGSELLLPAIKDCIRLIDIENQKMVVYLMPGLE